MNEHAGPACALSVLIVGAFAILLHDKDQPPKPSTPIARQTTEATTRPVELPETKPASIPEKPAIQVKAVEPTPATASVPAPKPKEAPKPIAGRPQPPPVETTAQVVLRPAAPRGPFTVVEAGESLADVAVRVYGSAEAIESLWKANRDQVSRLDSPLARGMLLRTP